jgi:hypothetical protein
MAALGLITILVVVLVVEQAQPEPMELQVVEGMAEMELPHPFLGFLLHMLAVVVAVLLLEFSQALPED